jgi:hypothetical protein
LFDVYDFVAEATRYLSRTVLRTIVDDNDFVCLIGLGNRAVQRVPEPAVSIIGGNDNCNFRSHDDSKTFLAA